MLAPSVLLFSGGISTGVLLCLLARGLLYTLRARANTAASPAEAISTLQKKRLFAQWIRLLVHRSILILALILAYGLFASFASAQTTLQRVDPVVFSALQLSVLLPFALVILGFTMRASTRESVRIGFVGGIPLGIGFVCVALSLHALGIIPTAMLTGLDGLIASLISWLVFRQQIAVYTCLATFCASVGAIVLWWIAPSQWQPDLVALACGMLFTLYAFHVERHAIALRSFRQQFLPFFGGLFCAMAMTALVLALCFGRWEGVQALTTTDLEMILYCGLATVLVPQVILTILLRQMSALTLAFCAVLEPLISIGFASLWGKISLDLFGWCGVGLILLSMLLQTYASRKPMGKEQELSEKPEPASSANISAGG